MSIRRKRNRPPPACAPRRNEPELRRNPGMTTSAALLMRATLAHAHALAAIHAASFPLAEQWGPDVMALQLGLPGAFGLVHLGSGMVLARSMADEAEILTLAVMPERRRDGLGRALLLAAMDRAAQQGARTMFLEVAVTNAPARSLYTRANFTQVGQRPSYYPDGRDALVLRAALGGEGGRSGPLPLDPAKGRHPSEPDCWVE